MNVTMAISDRLWRAHAGPSAVPSAAWAAHECAAVCRRSAVPPEPTDYHRLIQLLLAAEAILPLPEPHTLAACIGSCLLKATAS